MPKKASSEAKSCSAKVSKMQLLEADMCPTCFEVDQHNYMYWNRKGINTKKGICHKLYPEQATGWTPHDSSLPYWQKYKELVRATEKKGTVSQDGHSTTTFYCYRLLIITYFVSDLSIVAILYFFECP